MARSKESLKDIEQWFKEETARLWPAGLGSLSLRKSPCIREKCHACETGEQHPSYVLYCKKDGRRFALYIPDRLAPEVKQMLTAGRELQRLLYEAASRYMEALKRKHARGR